MMQRRHFRSPSDRHALGMPVSLTSETCVGRSGQLSFAVTHTHDLAPSGDSASAQLSARIRVRLHRRVLDREIAADERHADPASQVRVNDAEVLVARHGIVALIGVLRTEQAVTARGVALARLLVVERHSPMLCERSRHTVQQAVAGALAAL
jgi:hypothetical protein